MVIDRHRPDRLPIDPIDPIDVVGTRARVGGVMDDDVDDDLDDDAVVGGVEERGETGGESRRESWGNWDDEVRAVG